MTYTEKLQHPKWQRRRLDILTRDSFTCRLCSDTETSLHIHHKYYESNCEVWEYPDEALITYCKHCHAVAEYLKEHNLPDPLVAGKKRSKISHNTYITAIISHEQHGLMVATFQYSKESKTIIDSFIVSEAIASGINNLLDMAKQLI